MDLSSAFFLYSDPTGRILYANPSFCAHVGMDLQTLQEKAGPHIWSKDGSVHAHLRRLTPRHPVATLQHAVVLPSGEERVHRWTDYAFYTPRGEVVGYFSVGQDVTREVQTEQALARVQARLAALCRYLSSWSWEFDLTLHVTAATGTLASGTSLETFEGRDIREILVGDATESHPLVRGHEAALSGEPSTYRIDLHDHVYLVELAPTRDNDGTIQGGRGFAIDETTSIRYQELTRLDADYASACFWEYPVPLLACDAAGFLQVKNAAFMALQGEKNFRPGHYNVFEDPYLPRDTKRDARAGREVSVFTVDIPRRDDGTWDGVSLAHFWHEHRDAEVTLHPVGSAPEPSPRAYVVRVAVDGPDQPSETERDRRTLFHITKMFALLPEDLVWGSLTSHTG